MSATLDEMYLIKAQNELRETDEIKREKLLEFRQWLAKHEYFKNSRQGEILNYNTIHMMCNLLYTHR